MQNFVIIFTGSAVFDAVVADGGKAFIREECRKKVQDETEQPLAGEEAEVQTGVVAKKATRGKEGGGIHVVHALAVVH